MADPAALKKKAEELRAALKKLEAITGVQASSYVVEKQADAARFFGVTIHTMQLWSKSGCPGKRGSWPLDKIHKWLMTEGPCHHKKNGAVTPDGDPLLAEGDSPGLERYRQAKAALAELELEERKQSLVTVENVRTNLTRWSSLIRRMGEALGKRFGPEAVRIVNDALEDCSREVTFHNPSETAADVVGESTATEETVA